MRNRVDDIKRAWVVSFGLLVFLWLLTSCNSLDEQIKDTDYATPIAGMYTVPANSPPETGSAPNVAGASLPTPTNGLTSPATQNIAFADLFIGAPVVKFDPNATSDNDALVTEIAYFVGGAGPEVDCGGWDEYVNRVIKSKDLRPSGSFLGIYSPLVPPLIWIEAPQSATIHYTIFDGTGIAKVDEDVALSEVLSYDPSSACGFLIYSATINIPRTVSDFLGNYTVQLESSNAEPFYVSFGGNTLGAHQGRVEFSFAINVSKTPQVYLDGSTMYILGFSPEEYISVRCYDKDVGFYKKKLGASNVFKVDSKGRLVVIDLTCPASGFILVKGARSGFFTDDDYVELLTTWRPFPECPESRLHVGDQTQVSDSSPLCSRLRSEPNTETGKIIDCLDPGVSITLIDGPQCGEGLIWWKVKTENGNVGWIAEGDEKEPQLVPPRIPYVRFTAIRYK